jgi:hypothetical protein
MNSLGNVPVSVKTARVGIFAALYVATSIVPISAFIGAPSFLALNIVLTPVIAFLLGPYEAFSASLIGGLISIYLSPSQAMFGAFSVLLPVVGATFGSLSVHKGKMGHIAAGGFLAVAILAYLTRNYSFPYFVSPHSFALAIAVYGSFRGLTPIKIKVPIGAFISTMCEQGMMMIFATHLLKLPAGVFSGILPLMLYERLIATLGASILILAILRAFPSYFE